MATAAPDLAELRRLTQLAAPVTLAREHTLPVIEELRPLLPEGGLRRGSTVALRGSGASALAIALTIETSRAGGWIAGVGVPWLGLRAIGEAGAALERWAFVDEPGEHAAEVLNALLAGVDLLVVGPEVRVRLAQVRRLAPRLRERGTSIIRIGTPGVAPDGEWPADFTIDIERSAWTGVQWGHGRLRARRVEVVTGGRGAAARARRLALWMPDPEGQVRVIETARLHRPDADQSDRRRDVSESAGDEGTVVDLSRRVG